MSPVILRADDAVTPATITISETKRQIQTNHLTLGANTSPDGHTFGTTSQYLLKDGKPWLPVMGEFHFSRYPRELWENEILKMKANGVNIIATYIFWIHNEEVEGTWNWTGNRDLRAFVVLCAKHGMYVYPRIGPWAHGEARNGGFPDWLLTKGTKLRSSDPAFLGYVKLLYAQIADQLKGLYFKDGGPIIGVQIENEHGFSSPSDLAYMLTLKKMAVDAGIDVPYYTATGWTGVDEHQTELIPVWGAYPEAPWDERTTDLGPNDNYLFSSIRRDPAIGADQAAKNGTGSVETQTDFSGDPFPYLTAEMGGGHEVTYHRRPIITAPDVTGMAIAKLGSGANALGYYMFHGGSNPIGVLSTLQESRTTHYPNDMPIISYDFQAPISEWGELRPSYREYKLLHLFLNDFGSNLATAYTFFPDVRPENQSDTVPVRWSVRAGEHGGFLFINNYQREVNMSDHRNVQFQLNVNGANQTIPITPVTIVKDAMMIWPFDQDIAGHHLRYATAQPLCILNATTTPTYVFFAPHGIAPEYLFDDATTVNAAITGGTVAHENGVWRVSATHPGTGCVITLTSQKGAKTRIVTLNDQQALDAWKARLDGEDRLILSSDELTFDGDRIHVSSTGNPSMQLSIFPKPATPSFNHALHVAVSEDGVFSRFSWTHPIVKLSATAEPVTSGASHEPDPALTTTAQPGPQYGAAFQSIPGAKVWNITIPQELGSISEAYLRVRYTGDTAAAYIDNKLVADDFYTGPEMTIGLKRFNPAVGAYGLKLQIVPLTDNRHIYFETGVREPLTGRNAADLQSVNIDPVYDTTVTFLSKGKD